MSPTSGPEDFSSDAQLGAVVDDRRLSERRSERVDIQLTAMGQAEQHACQINDISENGLFLRVPSSAGLTVGGRCEVAFGEPTDSPALSSLAGETCFATVVRTAAISDDGESVVGTGLRFDQPLYF